MRHKFLIVLSISLTLFIFACTQEPASIVIHPTTSPSTGTTASNNPYKAIVQKGDTVYSIARKNNVEIRAIIEANRLRPPYTLITGQSIKLPKPTFHTVAENDNLYAISRSYGVDIGRLAKKNNLESPYNLTKGQKLLLPSPTESDADTNLNAKNNKYDYATKESQVASSSVTSSELLPLDKKSDKKVVKQDVIEDEESPFATSTSKPKKQVIASNKKSVNTKENDNLESAPFAYKSEKEFASSSKQANSVKVSTIAPSNNSAKIVAEEVNADDKIKTSGTFPPDDFKATPASLPKKVTLQTPEDSPFDNNETSTPAVAKNTTSTNIASNAVPEFKWPLKGRVISNFGPKKGGLYNDGINIEAKEGAPVQAAADGEVVYSGNELRGYGNMLLIKHNNGYLTAYAHTDDILVKKGDAIKKGQVVAHVGQTGHVSSPQLHFSIRQGRKAIDPEKYLANS